MKKTITTTLKIITILWIVLLIPTVLVSKTVPEYDWYRFVLIGFVSVFGIALSLLWISKGIDFLNTKFLLADKISGLLKKLSAQVLESIVMFIMFIGKIYLKSLLVFPLLVWAYQIISWLHDGEWHELSMVFGLKQFDIEWAIYPKTWLGFYDLLEILPLALAPHIAGILFLIIILIVFVFSAITETNDR